jgi:hypothetical protein
MKSQRKRMTTLGLIQLEDNDTNTNSLLTKEIVAAVVVWVSLQDYNYKPSYNDSFLAYSEKGGQRNHRNW